MQHATWFKIVYFGSEYNGPVGPYNSFEEAKERLDSWAERKGHRVGSIISAGNVSIVGPLKCSKKATKNIDISNYPKYL